MTGTTYNLRTFYILAVTQFLSLLGSTLTKFAVGVWVYTETGDTTPLLLISFFYWLPMMLLGSVGGVFADRLSRKRLIILGDAGQAIPTLLLALSFWSGQFEVWHLYAVAVAQAVFALAQGPALTASVTMLVPDSHRDRANAITSVTGSVAGLLAPALGGVLYAFIGITGTILIDLATFVIAVLVVATMTIPQPARSQESEASAGSLWSEVRGGIEFLAQRPGLLFLTLYFTFLNLVTNGALMLRTPYLLELTGDEQRTGLLLAVTSLGLVAGGLLTMVWRGTRERIHTVFPSLIGGALLLMVYGVVRSPLMLGLVGFLMMLPYKLSNALVSSLWQAKVPPDMQGRVFAFRGQLAFLALPFSYLLTGPLVDNVFEAAVGGPRWAMLDPVLGSEPGAGMGLFMIVCGFIWLVGSVAVYALPAVRYLERELPDYGAVAEPAGAVGAGDVEPGAVGGGAGLAPVAGDGD